MPSAVGLKSFVEAVPEEIQLFDKPKLLSAISDSLNTEFIPLNQTTDSPVLEFIIPKSEHFFSPSDLRLYLKCHIENLDNGGVPDSSTTQTNSASTAEEYTFDDLDDDPAYAGDPSDPDPTLVTNPAPTAEIIDAWLAREKERLAKNARELEVRKLLRKVLGKNIGKRVVALEQRKSEGKKPKLEIPQNEAVPVNSFFYALFERCEVELNDHPIVFGHRDYGYKGYINTLLTQNKETRKMMLRNTMWYQEDIGVTEADYPYTGGIIYGSGAYQRYEQTKGGRAFEMCGRLMHELFMQAQLLPPGIEIKIRLHRKDPKFCLLSNNPRGNFRIRITEAKLLTRFIKLSPKKSAELEAHLAKSPATYPFYSATDVRTRQLSPGMRSYVIDNFFGTERVPNRVVLAMVPHDAYVGSYNTDPFFFRTFGLEEAILTVDNQSFVHKIDQETKNYILLHTDILTLVGNRGCGVVPCVRYEDVLRGLALFPYDLTPNRDSSDIIIPKSRNVRVELRFREPINTPIELVAFVEYSKVFYINKLREVYDERGE